MEMSPTCNEGHYLNIKESQIEKNKSETFHLKDLVSFHNYFPSRVDHPTCALLRMLCTSVLAI